MRQRGFTLIEVVVTITTILVLGAIASLTFNSMNKKANVESQTRMMFADFMSARSQALYQKKGCAVIVTSAQFSAYSSAVVGTPVLSRALNNPVTPGTTRVDFDSWGGIIINNDDSITKAAVCVQQSSDAAVDSIVIYRSKIELGKLTGTGCTSDNITIR